jgi:hypothetical protein
MADEIDQANELADLALNIAIRNLRSTTKKVDPTGVCHYCEAEVGPLQLYCDSECASEHANEQRLKNRR